MYNCETRQVEFNLALPKKVLKKGEKKLTEMILAAEKVTEFVICTLVTGKDYNANSEDRTVHPIQYCKKYEALFVDQQWKIAKEKALHMFLLFLEGPPTLGKMSR